MSESLTHVKLGEAVHYKMFSWRTACGKVFDPAEKEDSQEWVTCKVCQRSRVHDYEFLNEYGPFGVGVIVDPYGIERVMNTYSVKDDLAEEGLRDYVIRIFHPLEPVERIEVNAKLPSNDMAVRLGEMLVAWRLREFVAAEQEPAQ